MEVTVLGIVIEVSLVQPSNAVLSIVVNPVKYRNSLNEVMAVFPLKTLWLFSPEEYKVVTAAASA